MTGPVQDQQPTQEPERYDAQPFDPTWVDQHTAELIDRKHRALALVRASTGELATRIELILTGRDGTQSAPQTPQRSGMEARVDRREEVARELIGYGVGRSTAPRLADALLPLIARLEREAAAKALNDAAAVGGYFAPDMGPVVPLWVLRNRAAAERDRAAALTDVDGVQS